MSRRALACLALALGLGCGARTDLDRTDRDEPDRPAAAASDAGPDPCEPMCARWRDVGCDDADCARRCRSNRATWPSCPTSYDEYLWCVATEATECDVPAHCVDLWTASVDCEHG